jgi:plasmid replication initiation protein
MELTPNLTIDYTRKEHNYQPNLITESRQEFSESEKRIVSFIINQLRKEVVLDWKGQNIDFLIPVSELTEKNHDRIKEAAASLGKKSIVQDFGAGKKEGEKEVYLRSITPFPLIEYYKIGKNSYIRATMLSNVVPYFIDLGKHYTRYSLEIILSLKSTYSQRFYEIIMMYVGRKQRNFTYSVEQLKFMFDCPDSYTYDEIKRWAIKPAQKELLEKANLIFDFIPSKKEGKKIIELEFSIKTKLELALDAMVQEADTFHKGSQLEKRDYTLRLLNNYKFTRKQQDEIMGDPKKWSVFMQIDSEIFNGVRNIENPTAYIAKSLGFDKVAKKK